MSQLPDKIYVPLHCKYGTLDYVTAYLSDWAFEENGYKAEDMQEYIPTYRCEERERDAKKVMIDKACEWMKQQVYQEYGGGPLERLVPDERIEYFRKAMEE